MNDQLANALAEAIRTGSNLAYPVTIAYFITKFFTDFLVYPVIWTIVLYGAVKILRMIIKSIQESEDRRYRR